MLPQAPAAPRSLRVRMYRVGFGDCFLLSHLGDRPWHILVDCGVHVRGDINMLEAAVRDVKAESDGRLAAIIVSHAHEDHIAGFGRYGDLFRQFEIGEIWLPWSEKPDDRLAISLRRKRAELAAALQAHFAVRPPSAAAREILPNLAVSRNHRALENLRSGFGTDANVCYLEAGQVKTNPGGVLGLTARVLGPPRDEDFLKKMDPPKAQRYLRAGPDGTPQQLNLVAPFADFVRPEADLDPVRGPVLSSKDRQDVLQAVQASLDSLAFALEDATNNCSIVALLSYAGRNLLFPGDAQWGSWKFWIEQADAAELLAALDFYKVSHHGSSNATPRAALEAMTGANLAAMMSTQSSPWPSIPHGDLVKALGLSTQQRLVRSDWIALDGQPPPPGVPALPAGFTSGRFWCDYTLPL